MRGTDTGARGIEHWGAGLRVVLGRLRVRVRTGKKQTRSLIRTRVFGCVCVPAHVCAPVGLVGGRVLHPLLEEGERL